MNCRCASHLISAYVDDELTPSEKWSLCEHLEQCETCRRELDEMLRLKHMVSEMPVCEAPEALRLTICDKATAIHHDGREVARLVGLLAASSLAAVLAAFLFIERLTERPIQAGDPPRPSFDVRNDQVYVDGSDPFSHYAPVIPAAYPVNGAR